MIVKFDNNSITTQGCGCCSNTIWMKYTDEVKQEALQNLRIVKRLCEQHKEFDFDELIYLIKSE